MGRSLRQYIRELRQLFQLDGDAAEQHPTVSLDDQVAHLVEAIQRSLTLAEASSTESARETNLGIARLNLTSLRALTSGFRRGVTPDVEKVRRALDPSPPQETNR